MNLIDEIFGQGQELTTLQMSARAFIVFIIALALIRVSGKRSFGMHMPFDNAIPILLGAILSRAVTGASPFFATIAASAVITVLHRLFAWICIHNDTFGKIVKGESKVLYADEKLVKENMEKCLVSEKDLLESIRINGNTETLMNIKSIWMERSGKISVVKKEK